MLANGRSTHLIATSNENRRRMWQHIFGTEVLPVMDATPRWQVMQGKPFDVLSYDLALGELTQAQRCRFAGHLNRRYYLNYAETLSELNGRISWPIQDKNDLSVVEPAGQTPLLASLLSIGRQWWKRPLIRLGFG